VIRVVAVTTAATASAATAAVVLLPHFHLAYRWPTTKVALETAVSFTGLLVAFLAFGRLRRRTRLNELLLASGLAALALSNVFFVVAPMLTGVLPPYLTGWAALLSRAFGALLFALGAVLPARRMAHPGRALAVASAAVALGLLLTGILDAALGHRGPPGLASPVMGGLELHGHLALYALQLLVAVLYGLAATVFLRRAVLGGDEFLGWLAAAASLAAVSQVNYFLDPPIDGRWFYTGDIFRGLSCLVLLAGSAREISSYWRSLSEAAVLGERRRIAGDLHDGLAQELAYLARHLAAPGGDIDEDELARLRSAAARAQLESRRALRGLAASDGRPADLALAGAVQEIAERFDVQLDLDLTPGVQLSPARSEALVRIACEAISNAARHSGTDQVRVSMDRAGERIHLCVSDDGLGFDTALTGPGFGLTSMRERARSVGGELRVRSAPGRGSDVEVAL